ncbi:mariner Mos1 transposase [Trichonephila clavipes]|nr:mariner Mos1 transposase [Trichonephila clavipes]
MIELPTKCEIRTVIHFLTTRNMSVADIHRHVKDINGAKAMSDSKVRTWLRKFKDGRTNVHDEERSVQPSVSGKNKIVTEDLNFKILCFRWILRLLLSEHKEKKCAGSLAFLICCDEEGDDMLSRIVTGEETWVSHITPRNQSNIRWSGNTHPLPSRSKPKKNAVKAQGYGNSVLRPAWCFDGGLNATRNNDQLRYLL